jgi:hypothetical protein
VAGRDPLDRDPEQAMLEPLSERDRATLDRLLSKLIDHLMS